MKQFGLERKINPEVNLINKVLKSKDVVTPLNSDIGRSFVLYQEEWGWIEEYYMKYRECPSAEDFFGIHKAIEQVDTDGAIEFYIEEVQKNKARLELQDLFIESATNLKELGPFQTLKSVHKRLAKIGNESKLVKDVDLINNADKRLESLAARVDLKKSGKKILGWATGVPKLDDLYQGVQKSDFWVVAGPTGSLKSYFSLYMAKNMWDAGARVLYFSLEMSAEQIGYRFDTLVGEGEFKSSDLSTGNDLYIVDRYKKWMDTKFDGKQPFIVVSNEDMEEVTQNTVRAKIDSWTPDVVFIDYIALMDDSRGSMGETEKIKNLSKDLKRAAIKTGVPIIAITGVTQDKSDIGKRPAKLHELAWSKQLGYDSDLCLSVFKEEDCLQVEAVKTRRSAPFSFWQTWDVDKGVVVNITGQRKFVEDDEDESLSGEW